VTVLQNVPIGLPGMTPKLFGLLILLGFAGLF
jgi:hypothetical protein